MNKLQKEICSCLIAAQASSDGGKNIYEELWEQTPYYKNFKDGYYEKTSSIFKAISLIRKNKSDDNIRFYYNVKFEKEYCSYGQYKELYIIYFNIKIYDKNLQISFHLLEYEKSVDDLELAKLIVNSKSCSTTWNKKISSRDTAMYLMNLLENEESL